MAETRGTAISLRFFSLELVGGEVWGGRQLVVHVLLDRVCNVSIPTLRTVIIQFYSS